MRPPGRGRYSGGGRVVNADAWGPIAEGEVGMKRQRAIGRPEGQGQQPKAPPSPTESVSASIGPAGVVVVTIDVASYPMVGPHWREQLTGKNARKWLEP